MELPGKTRGSAPSSRHRPGTVARAAGTIVRSNGRGGNRGSDGSGSDCEAGIFAVHPSLFDFKVVALCHVLLPTDVASGVSRVEVGNLVGVGICAGAEREGSADCDEVSGFCFHGGWVRITGGCEGSEYAGFVPAINTILARF